MSWKQRAISETAGSSWKDRAQPEAKEKWGLLDKGLFSARSALEGHTAGLSEPIIARGKAASLFDSLKAPEGVMSELDIAQAKDDPKYQETIDKDVEQRRQMKADMPSLDMSSQLAGALVPSPLNVGTKILSPVKGLVGSGSGFLAKKFPDVAKFIAENQGILGSAARVGSAAGKGAIEGGLTGSGFETVRQASLRPDQFVQSESGVDDVLNAAKTGAEFGGALSGGFKAIPEVISQGKQAGKKALTTFFGGVKPDVIDDYLARSNEIRAAKSEAELKEIADTAVGQIFNDFNKNKISVEQKKAALDSFQKTIEQNFRDKKVAAQEAVKLAKETLSQSKDRALQRTGLEIVEATKVLADKVGKGSAEAKRTLDESGKNIDLSNVYKSIYDHVDQLRAYGTDDAIKIAQDLDKYRIRLMRKNWAEIPAVEAKKLLRGLDEITQYSLNPTAFDKSRNAAFKKVRATLDETLKKQIPKYEEQMIPVAKDTGLLSQASKKFGIEDLAISRLKSINQPQAIKERGLLRDLGLVTKKDFISQVNEKNLPEYQALRDAEKNLFSMRPDRVRTAVQDISSKSKQASDLKKAQSLLRNSEEQLKPFSKLKPDQSGATRSQELLEKLGRDKNIETKRMFERLSKLTGTDFEQAIKDLRTRRAFEGGNTQGSRNVNIWGAIGGVIGGAIGGVPGAGVGVSSGVAIGGYMDRFGPQVTKKILDQIIKIKGRPTIQAISKMQLPEEVKQELARDLSLYHQVEGRGKEFRIQRKAAGEDNE